jgi:putative ABC transport system permease protein
MTSTFRALFAKPSYLIMSVVVLGVSIAAQITITSVVEAVLIRPPSGRDTGRLVFLQGHAQWAGVTYPDFVDFRERNTCFSTIFAYERAELVNIVIAGQMTPAHCSAVSGNYFSALGILPEKGRLLAPSDDVQGGGAVAMVSHELSQTLNLSVGSLIKINVTQFQVVGILPPRLDTIDRGVRTDVWVPIWQATAFNPSFIFTNRDWIWLMVGGRLKAGVPFSAAAAEISAIGKQVQRENPKFDRTSNFRLISLLQFRMVGSDSSHTMLLLFGIVWFLFSLAFTNFFTLTLLRLLTRQRELAIRIALGARKTDIGRWLLGELMVAAGLSLLAGYGLSWVFLWALRLNSSTAAMVAATGIEVAPRSAAVVIMLVAVCILTIWRLALRTAYRPDLVLAIRETGSAPGRHRTLLGLFAVQLAIIFFLVASAVSLVETLEKTASRPLPFRSDRLLLMDVDLRAIGHGRNNDDTATFLNRIMQQLRQVPGVVDAGASSSAPFEESAATSIIINGRNPSDEPDNNFVFRPTITGRLIETLGIQIFEGRSIEDNDILSKANVVVVDKAAANRFWPGQDPIGKSFLPWPISPPLSIVGVVDDVPTYEGEKRVPHIYLPFNKSSIAFFTLHIAVRDDSRVMRDRVIASVQSVWPYENVPPIRSIQDQMEVWTSDLARVVQIIVWLAGFATLVTGCGFYFFSSYVARQTIKDAAIRMALGARTTDVFHAHLRRYRFGILGGFLLGGILIAVAQPFWAQLHIGITTTRPAYLATAAVLIAGIASTGLCLPLRKIAGLNLNHVLRNDAE